MVFGGVQRQRFQADLLAAQNVSAARALLPPVRSMTPLAMMHLKVVTKAHALAANNRPHKNGPSATGPSSPRRCRPQGAAAAQAAASAALA
jgi:hypothetical protein